VKNDYSVLITLRLPAALYQQILSLANETQVSFDRVLVALLEQALPKEQDNAEEIL
jgi:hypothetical protein